jgi:hypothetical protein
LNGTNVNPIAKDMRFEMVEPRTLKMSKWISEVSNRMQVKINEKIKIMPKAETVRKSSMLQKISFVKLAGGLSAREKLI